MLELGKYMTVEWLGEGKTVYLDVRNKNSGESLGKIRWYGPWRQYCFYPTNALFNQSCLDLLARYLRHLNTRAPWDAFEET